MHFMGDEIKGIVNDKFLDRKASNKVMSISAVIFVIAMVGLFTQGFGILKDKDVGINLTIGDAPVLGNLDAPITIFEFSDFSCPFCAAANGYNEEAIALLKKSDVNWEAAMPKVIEEYVKTGKAKIVFKYARGHGTGQSAQIIGWCLNEQGLFWEFHDAAFANQGDISNFDKMKQVALSLGADKNLLDSCLSSNKYNSKLNEDDNYSKSLGISGTPTFFVNGDKIEGAQSFSVFKEVIDNALNYR